MELYHWGIKGMRWGIRRYQNPDGTLTEAGKDHYAIKEERSKRRRSILLKSDDDIKKETERMNLEKNYFTARDARNESAKTRGKKLSEKIFYEGVEKLSSAVFQRMANKILGENSKNGGGGKGNNNGNGGKGNNNGNGGKNNGLFRDTRDSDHDNLISGKEAFSGKVKSMDYDDLLDANERLNLERSVLEGRAAINKVINSMNNASSASVTQPNQGNQNGGKKNKNNNP